MMVGAYRQRRDLAMAELDTAGVGYVKPGGSFFLMADIRPSGLDSWTFARELLAATGVAVVPGAALDPQGDGHVRISLAASSATVAEGARRLGRFMAPYRT